MFQEVCILGVNSVFRPCFSQGDNVQILKSALFFPYCSWIESHVHKNINILTFALFVISAEY